MNPEIQKAWVEDLRTTEAQQTKGVLHRIEPEGFCCLGRLCVVMGVEAVKADPHSSCMTYGGNTTLLTQAILNEADMTDEQQNYCAKWNDDKGLSFAEIADKIEVNGWE